MEISFDEPKRQLTLLKRGLDFARAAEIFDGTEYTWIDDRFDYGEVRYNSFGLLDQRLIAMSWTIRDGKRRIISMRKANEREQARYRRVLG
ncbi:BrnT family toxin [Novosphingobium sp. JCM 18896]|uniref:BrnT family toxin n=1 Tax=Novosphingobium sp. JCM 18896 TaxID=2989731 RepID=UPI0022231DAB|nr:BrnT family toxin [Novosphingobium sp. JCM 18896]MCW1430464.1 BrnT family toxin [Novosphingobium sp. JCM 18896]